MLITRLRIDKAKVANGIVSGHDCCFELRENLKKVEENFPVKVLNELLYDFEDAEDPVFECYVERAAN